MIGEGASGGSNFGCFASVVCGIMSLGPGSKSSVCPRRESLSIVYAGTSHDLPPRNVFVSIETSDLDSLPRAFPGFRKDDMVPNTK